MGDIFYSALKERIDLPEKPPIMNEIPPIIKEEKQKNTALTKTTSIFCFGFVIYSLFLGFHFDSINEEVHKQNRRLNFQEERLNLNKQLWLEHIKVHHGVTNIVDIKGL